MGREDKKLWKKNHGPRFSRPWDANRFNVIWLDVLERQLGSAHMFLTICKRERMVFYWGEILWVLDINGTCIILNKLQRNHSLNKICNLATEISGTWEREHKEDQYKAPLTTFLLHITMILLGLHLQSHIMHSGVYMNSMSLLCIYCHRC